MRVERVDPIDEGRRLDAWLAARRDELSRSRWQDLIRDGNVRVNGDTRKPNYAVRPGDEVSYDIPEPKPVEILPEDIPLDILHEDADMIVINKQPGLVVHPAPGHDAGTLVNALLHHCKDLKGIGGEARPGLVHRLDRDTSGVLVVAKTQEAMVSLARQFKSRTTKKEYLALVRGVPRPSGGMIRTMIARDPNDRKKMTTKVRDGREAISHYEVEERFGVLASRVRVRIETGRTHQIRVHMTHIGHPVLGDDTYGHIKAGVLPIEPARQMLHAWRLTIKHPGTGEPMTIEAPLHADFLAMEKALREAPKT